MSLPLEPDPSFDYRTASNEAILARAELLKGHVLGDIVGASFKALEAKRGKGEGGAAIEAFFGILRTTDPRQISPARASS